MFGSLHYSGKNGIAEYVKKILIEKVKEAWHSQASFYFNRECKLNCVSGVYFWQFNLHSLFCCIWFGYVLLNFLNGSIQ